MTVRYVRDVSASNYSTLVKQLNSVGAVVSVSNGLVENSPDEVVLVISIPSEPASLVAECDQAIMEWLAKRAES